MRELIVLGGRCRIVIRALQRQIRGVDWRDQLQLTVKDVDDLVEIGHSRVVARDSEEVGLAANTLSNLSSIAKAQFTKNRSNRILVLAILHGLRTRREGVFEKRNPHTVHSTETTNRTAIPLRVACHLGKEDEANRTDAPVFGEFFDCPLYEAVLVPRQFLLTRRESTESTTQDREYFGRMPLIEQIDEAQVVSFHQRNIQGLHEASRSQPEIIPHNQQGLDISTVTLPQRVN